MSEKGYFVDLENSMRRSLKKVISEGTDRFIKDIKSAKWVIIGIITYFVLLRRMVGGVCPLVKATGYPCPSCGLTRAGLKLLEMDFAGAWQLHPFIYAAVFLSVLFVRDRYILGRTDMERLKKLLTICIFAMLVFYVYRMCRYFPGVPPMSYYSDNLLHRMREMLDVLLQAGRSSIS
jgi:hypothetical protein